MQTLLCPRCMRIQISSIKCSNCGFAQDRYRHPQNALPIGSCIGTCKTGIVLASSRQAICYSALGLQKGDLVLLEEFFPASAVKRDGTDVVQSNPRAKYPEAVEMFASGKETGRNAELINIFRANHTVYREYAATSVKNSQLETFAEELLDHPIFFRNKENQPILAINAFPIEAIPAERPFREKVPFGMQETFLAKTTLSAQKEVPRKVTRVAEQEKKKPTKRFLIKLMILLALLAATGFMIWKMRFS